MTASSPSQRVADLAERYWQMECHELPLTAAMAGVVLPDAVLSSALDVFEEKLKDMQLYLSHELSDRGGH